MTSTTRYSCLRLLVSGQDIDIAALQKDKQSSHSSPTWLLGAHRLCHCLRRSPSTTRHRGRRLWQTWVTSSVWRRAHGARTGVCTICAGILGPERQEIGREAWFWDGFGVKMMESYEKRHARKNWIHDKAILRRHCIQGGYMLCMSNSMSRGQGSAV